MRYKLKLVDLCTYALVHLYKMSKKKKQKITHHQPSPINHKIVNICDKIIEYGIYAIVFFVPIIICPFVYFQFSVEKVFVLQLFTSVVLITYLIKIFEKREIFFNRTTLEIPILFFFLANIFSTIFSTHPHFSTIGNYWRQEGLLKTTIWYIIIYFLIINNLKKEHIFKLYLSMIFGSVIVTIYSFLSLTGIEIIEIVSKNRFSLPYSERIIGTLGNPNFTGSYLAMIILLILPLFLFIKSYQKCLLLVFLIPAYIVLLFTYSRGVYLSLSLSLIICGVLIGKRIILQNKIWIILLLIVFSIVTYLSVKISNIKKVSISERAASVIDLKEKAISTRFAYWRGTLRVISQYLFFGTGPETLPKVFPKEEMIKIAKIYDRKIQSPDRPHNMYLQIAQSLGIGGLWAYLFLFITFLSKATYACRKLTNENERLITIGLVAGIFAYLIQSFFSFDIVEISVLTWYYIGIGMIIIDQVDINNKRCTKIRKFNFRLKLFFYLFILLFMATLLWVIIKVFIADIYFQQASILIKEKKYKEALSKLNNTIYLNPTYSIYYNSLAKCYLNLGQIEKAKGILNKALPLEIFPDFIYQNLAIIYLQQGNYKKGIQLLERALQLNPTLMESYSNLIQAYYKNGMVKEAISTVEKALKVLPNNLQIWYNLLRIYYYEKRYKDAVFVCRKILKLNPKDEEIKEMLKNLQREGRSHKN